MLLVTGALVELFLFVQVALWIGFLPMVMLAVATSLAGMMLMQLQGVALRQRLSLALAGKLPAPTLLQGGMGWFGALLLIIPGFLTDILGLVCLIPGIRRRLVRYFLTRLGTGEGGPGSHPRGARIIEGDFTREREERP